MSLGICDTCQKATRTVEVRITRNHAALWTCVPCGVQSIIRAQRLGMKGIVAPLEVWTAIAMELERARPPARSAEDGWLSKAQVEWTLRRTAEATAAALGHELGVWGLTIAQCRRCNGAAYVVPRTLGPSLSGPALSMECRK